MSDKFAVVVPWVNEKQLEMFSAAWGLESVDEDWLILQHDTRKEGCAVMKNRGAVEAVRRGFDVVVMVDDDCFPYAGGVQTLPQLAAAHIEALKPQHVSLFEIVTDPPSRGTPYADLTVKMPVAASMGFWTGIGDYCAVRQLATNAAPMQFKRTTVFGRYFPLCGMNLAFRPAIWAPWSNLIDVPRFDDIWMGWLWQREAYRRRHCFNLAGPLVQHSRQSNAWNNLRREAVYLEDNEALWHKIAMADADDYESLFALLPKSLGGSDR